jgi:hypothetical protein
MTRQSFASSKQIHHLARAGEKLGLQWANKPENKVFLALFSVTPGPYKKLLQISPVSGRLPTNIHEKMRQKG